MAITPELQTVGFALYGALFGILGYFLGDLHKRFNNNEKRTHAIEVLIAGNYQSKEDAERNRAEANKLVEAIFKKLDVIMESQNQMRSEVVDEVNRIKVTCAAEHGISFGDKK